MDQEEHEGTGLNDLGLECQDYTPIAAVTNLVPDYGEDDPEANGCDSCLHWQDGRCVLYANERY